MPQSQQKALKMTTEQAILELFPKRVVEKAKQVAAASDARTESPLAKEASGS
jgi:hypothetical protein